MGKQLLVLAICASAVSGTGRAEVLLKGIATQGDAPLFSLFSTDDQTSRWISLDQSFAGVRAVSFDPTKKALTVEVGGARKVLLLEQSETGEATGGTASKETFPKSEIKLRLIQLKRRGGETDEQLMERAKGTVVAKLAQGKPFADVAKEFSEDARSQKGGDWGWVKPGDLQARFKDLAFSLKNGEVSQPILLPEGYFLFFAEESH